MSDEERAEWLARLIDEMIRHGVTAAVPEGFDNAEAKALLDVARRRASQALAVAEASSTYETAVWGRVAERLSATSADKSAEANSSSLPELREFGEIISLRKALSQDAATMAAEYHGAVWERLQERIRDREQGRQPWPVSTPSPDGGYRRTRDLRAWHTGDPEIDSIVRVAIAQSATARDPHTTDKALDQLNTVLNASGPNSEADNQQVMSWPSPRILIRTLAVAAAVGLVVAALGPMPSTGLAGHPARQALKDAAEFIGVSATRVDPPAPDPAVTAAGVSTTAEEASDRLGLPVAVPDMDALGFKLASMNYFPTGITVPEGGVLVLKYEGIDEAYLTIYQEAAGGLDIASGANVVQMDAGDVVGAYFEGSWESSGQALTWGSADSQSLVFDRDNVRTIVQYEGPPVDPSKLTNIANLMATARAP